MGNKCGTCCNDKQNLAVHTVNATDAPERPQRTLGPEQNVENGACYTGQWVGDLRDGEGLLEANEAEVLQDKLRESTTADHAGEIRIAPADAATDAEVQTLQLVAAKADVEANPEAEEAIPEMVEVPPEKWGMTRQQCQNLLDKLREQEDWRRDTSMYTCVEKYIKPWTLGTGLGYALMVNQGEPKLVNVMVSHAWGENVEDFLEAIIRSTRPNDVLFICALALYQNMDIAGKTIQDQLGAGSAEETPFGRVLSTIRHTGLTYGWRWQWHPALQVLPRCFLFLSLASFFYSWYSWGCISSIDGQECAYRQRVHQFSYSDIFARRSCAEYTCESWAWQKMESDQVTMSVPVAMLFLAVSVASKLLLQRYTPYDGRMLVVPNHEMDLFQRLWCVYEIWKATSLKIPVIQARTLADAGSCTCSKATCSSKVDQNRILGEIFDAEGEDAYQKIDSTIYWTTHAAHLSGILLLVKWGMPLLVLVQAYTCVSMQSDYSQKHSAGFWGDALAATVGGSIVAAGLIYTFKYAKGTPTANRVVAFIGALILTGSVSLAIGIWLVPLLSKELGSEVHDSWLGYMLFKFFANIGIIFFIVSLHITTVLAGSFILPIRFKNSRGVVLGKVALFIVGLLFTHSVGGGWAGPEAMRVSLLFHLTFVITFICLPFHIFSTAATHWGCSVTLRKPVREGLPQDEIKTQICLQRFREGPAPSGMIHHNSQGSSEHDTVSESYYQSSGSTDGLPMTPDSDLHQAFVPQFSPSPRWMLTPAQSPAQTEHILESL